MCESAYIRRMATIKQVSAFARKRCKQLGFAPSKKLSPLAAKSGNYARAEQLIADEARRRALAKVDTLIPATR